MHSGHYEKGRQLMNTWLEDITTALRYLGGTAKYADLYAEIENSREAELPPAWQEIVRRTIQNHSSDSRAFTGNSSSQDLFFAAEGIGKGIWGLREMAEATTRSSEIPPDLDTSELVDLPSGESGSEVTATGSESPGRVRTETYRILRDTKLARQVKLLHRSCCQVCGYTIEMADGRRYAEAHHVIPLGGVHKGPDTLSNILVLCPNHHARMDMGLMRLEPQTLRYIEGHALSQDSIDYHNEKIVQMILTTQDESI